MDEFRSANFLIPRHKKGPENWPSLDNASMRKFYITSQNNRLVTTSPPMACEACS